MDLCGKSDLLGATEGRRLALPHGEEPLDLAHARSGRIVLGWARRGGGGGQALHFLLCALAKLASSLALCRGRAGRFRR